MGLAGQTRRVVELGDAIWVACMESGGVGGSLIPRLFSVSIRLSCNSVGNRFEMSDLSTTLRFVEVFQSELTDADLEEELGPPGTCTCLYIEDSEQACDLLRGRGGQGFPTSKVEFPLPGFLEA